MSMKIDYSHNFPTDEVKKRLRALGDYLQTRHGIGIHWADDTRATIKGKYLVVDIQGEMRITDKVVHFEGKDPGFLWRKKAKEYLEKKLSQYLNPATPLDSLPRA